MTKEIQRFTPKQGNSQVLGVTGNLKYGCDERMGLHGGGALESRQGWCLARGVVNTRRAGFPCGFRRRRRGHILHQHGRPLQHPPGAALCLPLCQLRRHPLPLALLCHAQRVLQHLPRGTEVCHRLGERLLSPVLAPGRRRGWACLLPVPPRASVGQNIWFAGWPTGGVTLFSWDCCLRASLQCQHLKPPFDIKPGGAIAFS